jgi:hypothetical protein
MFCLTLHVERESKCGAFTILHKSKIWKARGLQNITKTLTMLRFWIDTQVTVQTKEQWAHNAKNA